MKESLILLSCCALLFISCKKTDQESGEINEDRLNGLWTLESASRNGLETNTLQGLFYNFTDSTIISNITGDTSTAGFVMKEGRILHLIEDTIYYDIALLNDTFLEINSEIRSMPFQFKFKRVFEDEIILIDSLEADSTSEGDRLE